MLNIEIKKSSAPILNETKFINSKKVNIDIWLEWIIQISFIDKNISDIIERLIIDLLITKIDKNWDVYDSFSILLEKLNKEIKILSKDYALEELNIFIWICHQDILHFSILWNYAIYLIKNQKIIDIAAWMQGKNLEFSYISSWNINIWDNIFIANLNLLDYITKDDLFEISRAQKIDKLEIIEQILSQEITSEQYNIISIWNESKIKDENYTISFDLIKSKFLSIKDKISENEKIDTIIGKIKSKIDLKNKYVYLGLLGSGVIIAVYLLYVVIGSIINTQIQSSVPEEYKNKLIEARLLLERTNKDFWNKEVFANNIKKAEDIIFEVRWKWIFKNDVDKLLSYISILKKQANWIETVNLSKENEQIGFWTNFNLVWIYENNKKYYYVWKDSIIWPYIKWDSVKSFTYPDWEEVISADVDQDWSVFLLTKSSRVLKFYKQEFKYVNVEWQQTWEQWLALKTYNWNVYILSDKKNQIYRHKPWVSWFSARFWLISENDSKQMSILDFAIDGWFYSLKQDLTINKFFTTPEYNSRSIIINNLPKNYSNTSWENPKLFVWQNLNYLYMLLDNKIRIFEADSRNYKDVKSIRYVWQLESSQAKIISFYTPKDGTIFVWTKDGVYQLNFEVSDGKVIVR